MLFGGIDIGSSMTKVVIMDENDQVLIRNIVPTGAQHSTMAREVFIQSLEQAGLTMDQIAYLMATGYGRINVPFAHKQMSEVTCQAAGVAAVFPEAKTVIDIGGQDSKGLKLENGLLADFVMNDKCAAGTGRFLEVLADTLGLGLEEFGPLSLKAENPVKINNFCTIFAREEITARISEGKHINDIIAGVHQAIAGRVVNMVRKIKIQPQVVFTAGLSTDLGMVKAMEELLGCKVEVPNHPFTTVAHGAAIMGKRVWLKNRDATV